MPYVDPEFLECPQITPETCDKEIKFKGLLTYLINFMLNRNMDDMLETGQRGNGVVAHGKLHLAPVANPTLTMLLGKPVQQKRDSLGLPVCI